MGPEIKAAIDIGSNTVLLLVAEVEGEKLKVVCEKQRAPRLGRGVDEKKNLHPVSMDRAVKALQEYQMAVEDQFPRVKEVIVVATSAVRDAGNRQDFIKRVHRETAFTIRVLNGREEAELTYKGAQSVLETGNPNSAVIDIGGGSTEIAAGKAGRLMDRYSFDIGSVRFTERYLKSSPPSEEQLQSCRKQIRHTLEKRSFNLSKDTELIGVAGTVTSLAAIDQGLDSYDLHGLNGLKLSRKQILSRVSLFSKQTADELLGKHPDILKGKADVFLGGLLILAEFMNTYQIKNITVSTGGIRHGALLK